jgi:hypothetical protein
MHAYTHDTSAGYAVGPSGFDVELPSVERTAVQHQGVIASLQKPAMITPLIGFNMPTSLLTAHHNQNKLHSCMQLSLPWLLYTTAVLWDSMSLSSIKV